MLIEPLVPPETHATNWRVDAEISNIPYIFKGERYTGMARLICIIHNLCPAAESADCQANEGSGGGM